MASRLLLAQIFYECTLEWSLSHEQVHCVLAPSAVGMRNVGYLRPFVGLSTCQTSICSLFSFSLKYCWQIVTCERFLFLYWTDPVTVEYRYMLFNDFSNIGTLISALMVYSTKPNLLISASDKNTWLLRFFLFKTSGVTKVTTRLSRSSFSLSICFSQLLSCRFVCLEVQIWSQVIISQCISDNL